MKNLTKLIEDAKRRGHQTDGQIINMIREYLQVLILKAIYQSKYGEGLSFMDGTCLRICYDLKRYSEDLDFTLDKKTAWYSFQKLNDEIASYLKNTEFDVSVSISDDKIVQKSFIKVSKILHFFGASPMIQEKLHVKIEIDTRPIKINKKNLEVFYITKFNEIFPIIKHRNETMFAGKILAILSRPYVKGRDYYDLIWYLSHKIDIDLVYLRHGLKQAGKENIAKDRASVMDELTKKIDEVDTKKILNDISQFLENPGESWIKNYKQVFEQLI